MFDYQPQLEANMVYLEKKDRMPRINMMAANVALLWSKNVMSHLKVNGKLSESKHGGVTDINVLIRHSTIDVL